MTLLSAPLLREDLDHAHAIVGSRWARLRGRRVFLTGGTGFVGKWLLATLIDANERLALGCSATVLTRDAAAFRARHPEFTSAPCIELVEGDVRDFSIGAGAFSHVIHAATDVIAANTPIETFDTCVQGTRQTLEFARRAGAEAVLLISSGAVYGAQPSNQDALTESWNGAPDPQLPNSAYGEGKRAAEWLGTAFAANTGIRVSTARCFAFVGPYLPLDKHFAIGNFLRDAMAELPIVIQGDGTPFRSYLHASDMAAWLWAILLEGRSQTAYNVGGEEAVSIAELAGRVVRTLDSTSTVEVQGQARAGVAPQRYVPDVSRARTELGLTAPLSLDEAIARTARWHKAGWTNS